MKITITILFIISLVLVTAELIVDMFAELKGFKQNQTYKKVMTLYNMGLIVYDVVLLIIVICNISILQ